MLEELKAKRSAMTVKEVADILSLSRREIYKLAASNQIPHFKIGSSVRFEPSMVLIWLEEALRQGLCSVGTETIRIYPSAWGGCERRQTDRSITAIRPSGSRQGEIWLAQTEQSQKNSVSADRRSCA